MLPITNTWYYVIISSQPAQPNAVTRGGHAAARAHIVHKSDCRMASQARKSGRRMLAFSPASVTKDPKKGRTVVGETGKDGPQDDGMQESDICDSINTADIHEIVVTRVKETLTVYKNAQGESDSPCHQAVRAGVVDSCCSSRIGGDEGSDGGHGITRSWNFRQVYSHRKQAPCGCHVTDL